MGSYLWLAVTVAFVYMCAVFLVATVRRDNGLADVAWGGGFVAVAAATLLKHLAPHPRQLLVLVLVLLWGARLAWHISLRNRGEEEDFRYRKWREEWGEHWRLRSFLQVYMLQGAVLVVVALPVVLVNRDPGGPLGFLDVLGVLVWAVGFLFEAVGDRQLLRFVKDPANAGRIMQTGLWRYSRHPNYFGEATLWWGIFLIASSVPYGILAILSPLTIDFLLLKVSGIPMLEKRWEGKPEFEDYKRRTNALVPWFPRS